MRLDPEGKKFIYVFLILALFCVLTRSLVGFVIAGVFVLLALFSLFFFRDPEREPPDDEMILVSPADGRVVFAGEYNDPAFGPSLRIGVFMSLADVHINRAPFGGVVELVEHADGGFKHAASQKAFGQNERQSVFISTEKGAIVVHQIAGMVARRIVCRVKEGQKLERGEKIGMIRFGSRVEVIMPQLECILLVKEGDKVKCGKSAIAKWI